MFKENRDYLGFLEDILFSIEKIEKYSKNSNFDDFCKNDMLIDAIVRNFEVIGEAAKNIPNKVKETYPEVEWKKVMAFRNVLIHEYFGIDLESVWDTVKKNIPSLKSEISKIIREEKQKGKI
jgi:uncharacterized protein with HEPN domain